MGCRLQYRQKKAKYYQIGLAESKYDFKNYILFQRPYNLGRDEDPNAEHNGLYAEANGDTCFNKVEYVKMTATTFEASIDCSLFTIDISNAKISEKFKEYAKKIFGELLSIE